MGGEIVGQVFLFSVLVGMLWFGHRWLRVVAPVISSHGLTRTFVAAAPAWSNHLRWARSELMTSLRMREEAWVELDGERLDLADEFLREDLHNLGGLAGAW